MTALGWLALSTSESGKKVGCPLVDAVQSVQPQRDFGSQGRLVMLGVGPPPGLN